MEFVKSLPVPEFKNLRKKMSVLTAGLALLMGCSVLSVAFASSTVELATGKVPVENRASRTLSKGTRQAIEQLLVRITGQQDINDYQAVDTIRQNANRYLRAYRFTEEQGQLYLVAEFDRDLIESELVRLRMPIWGSRRPDALLWLVVEDDEGERRIVDDGNTSALAQAVRQQTVSRGVPLALPLMDIDDTLTINGYDVWGMFPEQLVNAAKRYNVDYVLGARLYPNRTREVVYRRPERPVSSRFIPEPFHLPALRLNEFGTVELPLPAEMDAIEMCWVEKEADAGPVFTQEEFSTIAARARKGRYSLDYLYLAASQGAYTVTHQTVIGDEPAQLIAGFINDYANYLGQNFAILPGEGDAAQSVSISVGNLSSLAAVVAVQAYLQNLSVTDNVMLIQQQGMVSTFQLNLLGNEQDLRSVLALDKQLQPLTDAFGQPLEGMHYFWSQ
ncbi:DUF2066 domain-containing protein [Alteromonas lipolytica]|nr:DUF2066 domain-containing protein [Alteromonas lipolytica]